MANRVSPNRMELMRLKSRLKVASRGHKLLKDKRDGLMRFFVERIEYATKLRKLVDTLLEDANAAMTIAESVNGSKVINEALLLNSEPLKVKVDEVSVMSLSIPRFEINFKDELEEGRYPYGLASTSSELDTAIEYLQKAFPALLTLASAEKEIQMLAREIETTRRRVNSLEHFMIPEMEAQIKSISMRLEENERDNITRLMKVKDQIIADEQEKARAESAKNIAEYKERLNK